VLIKLTHLFARLTIFDIAEVETSNFLATSANASQCSFTNPIAIQAITRLAVLCRLPPPWDNPESLTELKNLD
jgi:hypothetical protein